MSLAFHYLRLSGTRVSFELSYDLTELEAIIGSITNVISTHYTVIWSNLVKRIIIRIVTNAC